MGDQSQRSKVPGGAEDEVITDQGTQDAEPTPVTPDAAPVRPESFGPYDEESVDATEADADYDADHGEPDAES